MQANSCHKLFHFYLSFESGKCGKEGKNYKNLNISGTEKNV